MRLLMENWRSYILLEGVKNNEEEAEKFSGAAKNQVKEPLAKNITSSQIMNDSAQVNTFEEEQPADKAQFDKLFTC